MQLTRISFPTAKKLSARRLVAPCFEGSRPVLGAAGTEVDKALEDCTKQPDWQAKTGQIARISLPSDRTVELHGLGLEKDFGTEKLVRWLATVIKAAETQRDDRIALFLPAHSSAQGNAAAVRILRQLALSRYRFDDFRSTSDSAPLRAVQVVVPERESRNYRQAASEALAVAEGIAWSRDLGNTPPNVATPSWMAARCRSLAREHGLKCRVLGVSDLRKKGMGGILAVGGGSANSAKMVRLEWGRRGPIVALVGKGVTFDTGGISIKPAADMDEMKYDKCGACTALGVVRAAVRADLGVRLRVYLPLAENMPSSKAYRPGDIVRCYNKKTVEVLNTDAEGRLILADALAWAVEEKPDQMIEYSTLTGASMVALGDFAGALFTPSDRIATGLLTSAEEAGERLWRMPMWPEYVEQMKGNHADLKNAGERWGGACTAAAFLSQFVGDHSAWAHLDIAGPAMASRPKGATGYGVALTFRWLQRLAKEAQEA